MRKFIYSLIVAATLFACSKKDDNNSTAITKQNIAGTYKITSVKVSDVEFIDQAFELCQKDDLVKLDANGTVSYIDAGTKCNPAGDDSGTWDLNGNTLTIDSETATIESFTGSQLVISGTYDVAGSNVPAKVTFTRQ